MKTVPEKVAETLQSLDSMQQAEANPFLYSKILNRLQQVNNPVQQQWAWRLAMVLSIVAIANIFTLFHDDDAVEKTGANDAARVATEYSISISQTY